MKLLQRKFNQSHAKRKGEIVNAEQRTKGAMIVLDNNKPYCPFCLIGMGIETDASRDSHWIVCKNPYCPNYNNHEGEIESKPC